MQKAAFFKIGFLQIARSIGSRRLQKHHAFEMFNCSATTLSEGSFFIFCATAIPFVQLTASRDAVLYGKSRVADPGEINMERNLSPSDIKGIFEKHSNWSRWGKNDERGALNFITNQKRAAAAKLVKTGETISMALPLATVAAIDNPNPVTHLMVQAGTDAHEMALPYSGDYFAIAPHGMANTHLDALCHVFWEGKMYNGFDASEVGSHGAKKCAIDVTRAGVVTRGVLLDFPRLKKIEWMEPGDAIFPQDLDACEKAQRVQVTEGDALMVRTGRSTRRKVKGAWDAFQDGMPGLDASCLPWLHERKVAILGCDAVSDVVPSGYDGLPLPVHVGTLVYLGIHLIDNADLDALSAACGGLDRFEFMFSMAPLILERGTASPVNPIAIF
jgi:kynurenine formamidase